MADTHPQMEAKNDDHEPTDTKDEPAPPLAPTLKIVAKQFLARPRQRWARPLWTATASSAFIGDFVEENADEFEGFDPSGRLGQRPRAQSFT